MTPICFGCINVYFKKKTLKVTHEEIKTNKLKD